MYEAGINKMGMRQVWGRWKIYPYWYPYLYPYPYPFWWDPPYTHLFLIFNAHTHTSWADFCRF